MWGKKRGVSRRKGMAGVFQGVGTRHLWALVDPDSSCKLVFYCCTCKSKKKKKKTPWAAIPKNVLRVEFKIHGPSGLLLPVANHFISHKVTYSAGDSSRPVPRTSVLKGFKKLHDNSCRNFATAQALVNGCPWWTEMLFKGVWMGALRTGRAERSSSIIKKGFQHGTISIKDLNTHGHTLHFMHPISWCKCTGT